MRRTLLALCLSLSVLSGAADVLPEMAKHLAFGHDCLRKGYQGGALAAANLVLLDQIRVYVDESGSTPQVLGALSAAEFIWEDALDGQTKFVRVPNRQEADVVVGFQSTLAVGGQEAGGFAEWTRSVRWVEGEYTCSLRANLKLRTVRPDGKPMSRQQALQAALHEYGHILGLDDSSVSGEVMAPLNLAKPVGSPTAFEVATLRSLRAKATSLRAFAEVVAQRLRAEKVTARKKAD